MPYKNKEDKKKNKREYYIKNKEKIKEYKKSSWRVKQYCISHKREKAEYDKNHYKNIKKEMKKYYQKNREKILNCNKRYNKNNLEKKREYGKQYYKNHLEKLREYFRLYQKNHRKQMNEYQNNRRKADVKYNLNHKVGTAISHSLKGNKAGRHWEDLVEYTIVDLKKHLQKTIPKGCAWNDFLEGRLHIDHIIPISAHNFTKPEHTDFKRCWALSNLQLLPARENRIKNAKLSKPFQPALII